MILPLTSEHVQWQNTYCKSGKFHCQENFVVARVYEIKSHKLFTLQILRISILQYLASHKSWYTWYPRTKFSLDSSSMMCAATHIMWKKSLVNKNFVGYLHPTKIFLHEKLITRTFLTRKFFELRYNLYLVLLNLKPVTMWNLVVAIVCESETLSLHVWFQ